MRKIRRSRNMTVGGVLYLHDISRPDFSTSTLTKSLDLLLKLCGKGAMDQTVFVTTKWDRLEDINEGMERALELQGFWRAMLKQGASECHISLAPVWPEGSACAKATSERFPPARTRDPVQAGAGASLTIEQRLLWPVISDLVRKVRANQSLRIQDEMVGAKLKLSETAAGQELKPLPTGAGREPNLKRHGRKPAGDNDTQSLLDKLIELIKRWNGTRGKGGATRPPHEDDKWAIL